MTIKSKIFLVNALILLIVIASGLYLTRTYQKVPRHLAVTEQVNQLVYELSLLNLAVINYQYREVERASQQWASISKNVDMYIDYLKSKPISKRHIKDLSETHDSVDRLFHTLLKNEGSLAMPLKLHISSLISSKVFDMIMTSHLLLDEIQGRLKEANRKANYLIILFTGIMVFIMANLHFFFRRTVVRPLNELERGVKLIGEGDFDVRVRDLSNDEIGHLGLSINRMSANLKALTKSKDEFLSTAAHELKTPLTVLKTTAQLMMDMSEEETKQFLPYALRTLNRQCDYLNKLVVDVLEVSRLEVQSLSLSLSDFDLSRLLKQVCQQMQVLSDRHNIKISKNPSVKVNADESRVEQVLMNLVDNAMKYSPKGGPIELWSEIKDDMAVVAVKDQGIGIPVEKQNRIFERFFRAHADTPYGQVTSLGVGLFLSKQFAQRHGGDITFVSEPGKGSTFYFSLPLHAKKEDRVKKEV